MYDEITLSYYNQQRNMRPGKQTELLHVVSLDKRQNKPDKANAIQSKGQKAMVSYQKLEILLKIKENIKNVFQFQQE